MTEAELQAALSKPFPDGVVSCKPLKTLKELAKLRGIDETQQYTAFLLKSFAPNIVTVSDMPPEMIGKACEKVRKAIKAEQDKPRPTE